MASLVDVDTNIQFFFLNFVIWTDFINSCHIESPCVTLDLQPYPCWHDVTLSSTLFMYVLFGLRFYFFSWCFIYGAAVSIALIEFTRFWCHTGFLAQYFTHFSQTQYTRTLSLTPLLSVLSSKHWFRGAWFTPSGIVAINMQKKRNKPL